MPETSITKTSRILCGECDELRRVAKVEFDELGGTVVTLRDCLHTRGEILPLTPGRISVENMNTRTGYRVFPVVRYED